MTLLHLPLVTYRRPAPALGVETIVPAAQAEARLVSTAGRKELVQWLFIE